MNRTDDLRLGSLFNVKGDKTGDQKIKVALIAYCVDEGVARNGGRVGSSKGPDVILTLLKRKGSICNAEYNMNMTNLSIEEFGQTVYNGNLKETHKRHEELVLSALRDGYFPIIIGGGNDQSYPNFLALSKYLSTDVDSITVINVDAHLDVRPTLPNDEPHSGSPFRQIMEHNNEQTVDLIEFASQGNQCSTAHVQYVHDVHGKILWLNKFNGHSVIDEAGNTDDNTHSVINEFRQCLKYSRTDQNRNKSPAVFFSFDIDSIRSSDCPGVSCPGPLGLTAEEALGICLESGRNPAVRLFDISEFNPAIETNQTSILVVNMIYYFLLGLANRQ